jgi:hemerythrin-like domain-containing protein
MGETIMKPTDELMQEHEAIKLMLKILERAGQMLEAGEKVDAADLDGMLELIRVFADKCHHHKEEDLLFPALQRVGIPKEQGPIGVMLMEHESGRNYVRGMAEGIEQYKIGDTDAYKQIAANARNYIKLLSEHIYKEDNVLYPMADARLSEKDQETLHDEFSRVEKEVVGRGKHEEFHRLLDRLQKIYLK